MAREFTFHSELYLSESISEKKLDKIKRKLVKKPLLANVYLIVPARNGVDQLDIFDARQLALPHYRNCSFHVIGIAVSHEDALTLVEKLVKECLEERGDCKLREYLSC